LALSSSAMAADACPSLSFQSTGPASAVHTTCAGADLNGVFQQGQAAQFSYAPPVGYVITSLDFRLDPYAEFGSGFTTYVVIDGQEQRFRGEKIPNLHASSATIGIRCDQPATSSSSYYDTGCGGDYFALSRFSVELEMVTPPAAPSPAPAGTPAPQPCNRARAAAAGVEYLEPYAVRAYPQYWGDIKDGDWMGNNGWRMSKVYCRDLTGDGQAEMIATWLGGTGGSVQPWAIFKRDDTGQWKMAYAQVRDTTYTMTFRGRTIVAPKVAEYNGAFTDKYRKRYVRWDGKRFVSRVGPVYKIHNPNNDRYS
jgi:hypothetical protein